MSESFAPSLDRWGRSSDESIFYRMFRLLYHSWFRVEWEGLENLPRTGGALLVSNHAGMLPVDGGIIAMGVEEELGRPVYGLAHHGFFKFPFLGQALERFGAVVGHPDNAHRLLHEDGSLVMVFPEGEKGPVKPPSERYRLQRFGRGGFVETAMRAGVPIVPIALMGTEDATPVLAKLSAAGNDFPLTLNTLLFGPILGAFAPFPAKIRGQILPPVQWDDPPNLETYPRSLVMDRSEAIRANLQDALNVMLRKRKSIWTG
jgi:1-acyl-sn-glycerol-3-phosphate acyltransferase